MNRNPFIVSGRIPDEYFCDRVEETSKVIKLLTNGNNIVMISPRRMGKTGLIKHCFDKPEIKKHYQTIIIDILQTTSLQEFTFLLGKEIFESLLPKSKKFISRFILALKSLTGKFGYDPVTNAPTFSIQLGDIIRPEYTLKEIFNFIDSEDIPCIIAIDEFQQICTYPERNVEAILRTYIQGLTNCKFIFAGSRHHLMREMFSYPSRPFYNSASIVELDAIPMPVYGDFIKRMFEKFDKKIAEEDIAHVYNLFEGHTFYIQKVFNKAFGETGPEDRCTAGTISRSVEEILEDHTSVFREILSEITLRQKELLLAISKKGKVSQITSSEFIREYGLTTASSVQAAAKKLIEQDLITKTEGIYSVNDKFLSLWLNKTY